MATNIFTLNDLLMIGVLIGGIAALHLYRLVRVLYRIEIAAKSNRPSRSLITELPSAEVPAADEFSPLSKRFEISVSEATENSQHCGAIIAQAMKMNKLYLDPHINIERFANRIGETAQNVSCVLNRNYGVGFFEYINGCRVDEAKRLLIEESDLSITQVMMQSGFGSRSAFHRAFKSVTHKTAGQFRKENAISVGAFDGRENSEFAFK